MMRTKLHFQWDNDVVRFVLDQHAELDFYSAYSLQQQSAGRHVAPLTTHYHDCEPTSLCSYSFVPCAQWRSNKYKFELTTLVVTDTDCIGSCKSNYNTIMATTAHSRHYTSLYLYYYLLILVL
jgi:hypothetical protein